MRTRSRIGALILILIGVVFLLINLGVLPIVEVRELLAKWWPLILIVIGFWLLGRPRKSEQ